MKDVKQHTSIDFKDIIITSPFWKDRIELMAEKVIPYQWDALNDNIAGAEPSHAIENFRIAAGDSKEPFHGMLFQDSDVAKWIEAASYSLVHYPNKDLESKIDEVIELIGRAQQKDGYLNTYYTVACPKKRWTNFSFGHELYCAGHLIEAAVAHFNATGKNSLLDIVCRYADHIDSVMGPENNKMQVYCGHEEIELALVRLYHVTEEKRYLRLAHYFINERGKQPCFLENESTYGSDLNKSRWSLLDYHQAHKPVREQTKADGHAVRAMYLYTAMADIALETGEKELEDALEKLYDNVRQKRMYITGGLGSQGHAERFTFDYDLPNDTAYTETCAGIGFVFWMHRMLHLNTKSSYADDMERVLYNGILSGISLDGTRYFYVNPLEVLPEAVQKRFDLDHVKAERVQWFGCACCPPNIARLVTSIGQYIYTVSDHTIYTHLYIGGEAHINLKDGEVNITQTTHYPWEGSVKIQVNTKIKEIFTLALRIPDWCNHYHMSINGEAVSSLYKENGYLLIRKEWEEEEVVEIEFDMPVQLIQAHPKVRENAGKIAITRGPLVYCVEEVDNGSNLSALSIALGSEFEKEYRHDLLGGVVILKAEGYREDEAATGGELYRIATNSDKPIKIVAVPYSMWGNRGNGEMSVWIRKK
ncbi:MAG: hypothetical protein K0S30_1744 [Clostridia bacterium]|jgi:DUF1680 family protein|nr:hypothetical protein [Clostridia bacterium]